MEQETFLLDLDLRKTGLLRKFSDQSAERQSTVYAML
jgi:hypothetical protein